MVIKEKPKGKENLFDRINEPRIEHVHISHSHPNWKSNFCECVCGFRTEYIWDFMKHVDQENRVDD